MSSAQAGVASSALTADQEVQQELKQRGSVPEHIAIIMDGNGRWAREQGRPRYVGHREGVESVRDVTEACAEIGVKYLTLYTFSTENWHRPRKEVNALMRLLVKTTRHELKTLTRNGIRLNALGDLDSLPPDAQKELRYAMDRTESHDRMTLNLALSYSGRWELVRAGGRTDVQRGDELRVDAGGVYRSAVRRRAAWRKAEPLWRRTRIHSPQQRAVGPHLHAELAAGR